MIKSIQLKNFGPIKEATCSGLGHVNLLIGHNGSGKTFFLKSVYAALKTIEQYKKGKDPRTQKELLAESLYWSFQGRELYSLVKKSESSLSFSMRSNSGNEFAYSFGTSTTKVINDITVSFKPTNVHNIFIPAKEILSIQDVILKSFDEDKSFGFDKSYVDLARILSKTKQGRNYKEFAKARQQLTSILGGKLEFDDSSKMWIFKSANKYIFEVNLTSEGIKRLSILELLLGNHYLTRNSVIIIDEVEANLHPSMISQFIDILVALGTAGLQIFMSSHSYFVIKKLYLVAQQQQISIPVLSFSDDGKCNMYDLKNGMPQNAIIEESINLYKEEIQL